MAGMDGVKFQNLGTEEEATEQRENQIAPPLHLKLERGMNGEKLLENDLLNLTLPSRHFLLLAIRKIDDQVIGLLRGML